MLKSKHSYQEIYQVQRFDLRKEYFISKENFNLKENCMY